jgi:hypothetical protein
MAADLTSVIDLVGIGLNNAFGQVGLVILAVLFFLMIGAALRAGEVTLIFLFGLVILLTLYMGLSTVWFIGLLVVGSILIWLMFQRLILK